MARRPLRKPEHRDLGSSSRELFLFRYWHSLASAGVTGSSERQRICAEAEEHLAQLTSELEAAGWDPRAARREAVLRFGPPEGLARSWAEVASRFSLRLRVSALVLSALLTTLGLVQLLQATERSAIFFGIASILTAVTIAGATLFSKAGDTFPRGAEEPLSGDLFGSDAREPATSASNPTLMPTLASRLALLSRIGQHHPGASEESLRRVFSARRRAGDVALARSLLAEAARNLPGFPQRAYTCACLARAVLESDGQRQESTVLHLRALAFQAHSLRAQGRVVETEEPLERARFLRNGSSRIDRPTTLFLDSVTAAVAQIAERYDEAEKLLLDSTRSCLAVGHFAIGAKSLNRLAILYRRAGELETAIDVGLQAESLAAHLEAPDVLLCARNNLVIYLASLGRIEEARDRHLRSSDLVNRISDPWCVALNTWISAVLDQFMGNVGSAESHYHAARTFYLRKGQLFKAAEVGSDMVSMYVKSGRHAEAVPLASEVASVFKDFGVFPQAARVEKLKARASAHVSHSGSDPSTAP